MTIKFDRDKAAEEYARRHRVTDDFIRSIHYLPTGAPPNEIRLVEVNEAITCTRPPEPIDFGVDAGSPNEHKLIVLDVTPGQWEEIRKGASPLPNGWMLQGSLEVGGKRSRRQK